MKQFRAKGGGGGGGGGLGSHRGLNALEMERRKVEKINRRHQKTKQMRSRRSIGENVKLEQIANILNTAFP